VLNDRPAEFVQNSRLITTDRARIDVDAALALLRTTFWAQDLKRETLARAIDNSVCFALLDSGRLLGFARVISDLATFAYWTDVVIAASHRRQGLGRWLSECMLSHPELQNLRRVALLTRDAPDLYSAVGFTQGPGALTYMERRP
jgi:N-acetylglutamate synthase-like GNAT family acetyltransferase